ELARELPARRQTAPGQQRAIEDRLAQFARQPARQRLAAAGRELDVDQPRQDFAHPTGSLILSRMDLLLMPVKANFTALSSITNGNASHRWIMPCRAVRRCCFSPSWS